MTGAGRGTVHAQMPVRLSPRLARRAHAVSAALGRFDHTRCTRTGHCSRSRCFGRRDGDCWKSRHSTSASPTSPTSREATAAAPPPPDFLHRCARHARTHAQLAADCAVGQAAAATSAAPIVSHAIPMPEEAILGCSRGRNRTIAVVPHTYTAGSGFPGAIQQPPAPYMHPTCIAQRA